ncbi:Plug domain-containing protein [Empedobacter stercoris]|uniref:hypothetical protein n=1 Tax=Empedobacter stercoris TaxID=1628248 RepID=UPI00050A06C2|nr:hypothetical protein [Empedobacter stercoris]UWX66227.1 Plug domain-containing protein [Empedobacter stercoris]
MKYLLLSFLLIFTTLGFGQNKNNQELGLKSESDKWIENLEKIDSKEMQIHLIKEKIKQDSIINFKSISDKIVIKVEDGENINDALRKQSKCKIMFVLFQKNVGHLLDLNQYPNYSVILKYLTNETINSIEILKNENATSLYGSRAICGVVILKSNDRKLKKLIKKSLRNKKPTA